MWGVFRFLQVMPTPDTAEIVTGGDAQGGDGLVASPRR